MSNVENKLDKIQDDLHEIKETLVRHELLHQRNTETIEYHVRRSDMAEENLKVTKEHFAQEIKPIKDYITRLKGAVWALGIVGTIVYGLYEMGIIQKLFNP